MDAINSDLAEKSGDNRTSSSHDVLYVTVTTSSVLLLASRGLTFADNLLKTGFLMSHCLKGSVTLVCFALCDL